MSIGYQALGVGDIYGGASAAYDRLNEQAAKEIESCRRRYAYAVEKFEQEQVQNGHCGWCAEFSAELLHNWGYPVYTPNEKEFDSDSSEFGKAARSARVFEELLAERDRAEKAAAKLAAAQAKEAALVAAAHPFAALAALRR